VEALDVMGKTRVPVVMSDQRMPGMTGVEFLSKASRIQPEATRLLFTGYADLKAVVDAINDGHVFRYITKPWEPEELQTVVRQAHEHHDLLVERRRLIEELQRSNDRLVAANRLKDAFLEVASHELNTPVAVVLGLAELWRMTDHDASETERAWLARIQKAGQRLADTVDRMITLVRADRIAETLDLSSCELAELIERTVSDLAPFVQARGQTVRTSLAPDLGRAKLDPRKIADVLTNLLINAVKFTPDGGEIEVRAGRDPGDSWWMEVADSGVGITESEQKHLFEPFFTGFDTMHHSSGEFQFCKRGLGIGLCLVKSFVELHGGRVDLESKPGKGTRVRIELPATPPVPRSLRAADSGVDGYDCRNDRSYEI
jgi:signal transduction histidine kinase